MKRTLLLISLAGLSLILNGCVAAAVGAAAGYGAHKEGYRVQSPITKEQ